MISCPDRGWKSAASSPIPKATDRSVAVPESGRHWAAIFLMRESSLWRFGGIGFCEGSDLFLNESIPPEPGADFAPSRCEAGLDRNCPQEVRTCTLVQVESRFTLAGLRASKYRVDAALYRI
jgi:hypothetical protein